MIYLLNVIYASNIRFKGKFDDIDDLLIELETQIDKSRDVGDPIIYADIDTYSEGGYFVP